ncbi:CAS/CSE, C-terminal [Sesbania bispinosa]|nr:CAS/CSE, C-terminal [Sesbania bispinosa]
MEKSLSVPALVRLLQAFLQRPPSQISQGDRLTKVLGIFDTLIQSSSTSEQGFYVLNTVIESLDYDAIEAYISHIWAALFREPSEKADSEELINSGFLSKANYWRYRAQVDCSCFNQLICESPVLLDPAASASWGKMVDSIVHTLSGQKRIGLRRNLTCQILQKMWVILPPLFDFTMLERRRRST